MNLTWRILIGMSLGMTVGLLVYLGNFSAEHWLSVYFVNGFLDAGGQIFIASLKLMVVPLVFFSLTCGAANLGASGNMGRLGGKTIGLYLLTTAAAVSLALLVALVVDPGEGLENMSDQMVEYTPKEPVSIKDTLINIIPSNPVAAMAEGRMLQIIVFALLFGVALSRSGEGGRQVHRLFEHVNETLLKLVTMLVRLAPYGVFCLMATLFAKVGWQQIGNLIAYFMTVAGTLGLHILLVYPLLLLFFTRLSPLNFFTKMREPMLVAFSTSSSGATLPVTLRTVERRLGVRNKIASFSVPLGATINMDGTAIMQGVATVFIAQFYSANLELADYLTVILTATMASIGTAAVPGVGLVMLTMVLVQVGLPVEGIGMIIGVDRLLDMMRTAVNVTGDGMVATVVSHSEGEIDLATFNDPEAGRVIQAS